jgi:ABC-type transport system involved in cytochrome c biogenesis ATPase subunit
MRLRYLNLRDAPPLQRLVIPFSQESILGRECAIRFVVGVNGSGKSRLLQALAQIFLNLERAPNAQLPFYVPLAYDLGKGQEKRTIVVQYQPDEETDASPQLNIVEYPWLSDEQKWDWELLPEGVPTEMEIRKFEGSSGAIASFLPDVLLAYTSGATAAWETIFSPPAPPIEIPALGDVEERPLDWDVERERQFLREQGLKEAADNLSQVDTASFGASESTRLGFFIAPEQLRLAVSAVTLLEAARDFRQMTSPEAEAMLLAKWDDKTEEWKHSQSGLRNLLNEAGWRYPVTFGIRIKFAPEQWLEQDTRRIRQLYEAATTVIGEAEPGNERLLVFDLREPLTGKTQSTLEALIDVFREAESETVTAFDIFKQLYQWQQKGIVREVVLSLRKRGVKDLMLYDWLSDGEQEFIGRMALFHLLEGENDALVLLDEPETHFNDIWKRRIVDVIDDSLCNCANEIVITTHSSLALTDVFRIEVTLLKYDDEEGQVLHSRTPIHTFGASPTVIMREIFDAPESVGQRATEYLDLILMLATRPQDIQKIWEAGELTAQLRSSESFRSLIDLIQANLPPEYGTGEILQNYLFHTLKAMQSYTQRVTGKTDITVIDALSTLEDLLGEGFYQFEFRRRLRALRNLQE